MSHSRTPHPSEQVLRAFALGRLDDAAADGVNVHLENCVDCRERVGTMTADSFLDRFQGGRGQGARPRNAAPVNAALDVATLPPGLAENPDYEILKELGRGGMGVVYLVHNKLMGRDEAVKIIGKHLIARPEVLERFLREIRAVAKLRHENIVAAYSATRMGESLVYAMEYVDGSDLATLVKGKGPLPVAHASYFVHQTALGLQHAHENGLVHRDIKPGNLMQTAQGKRRIIKILDFGLTKAVSEKGVDGSLTMQNQMLGTPDYIAPEQIRDAQSADIRADIYSLGCTLYYLLTGHAPFQANSLYDLLQAHFSMDAHPLNLERPEVPAELACLVSKMMAKEPRRRFQTPGEVARALTPFFKPAAPVQSGPLKVVRPVAPSAPVVAPVPSAAPASPRVNEPHWESLIEFKQTEESIGSGKSHLTAGSMQKPPRGPRTRVVAAGAFSAFVLFGIMIIIEFGNGRFSMEVDKTPAPKPTASTAKDGIPQGDALPPKPSEAPAVVNKEPETVAESAPPVAAPTSPMVPEATDPAVVEDPVLTPILKGERVLDVIQPGTVWTGNRTYRHGLWVGKTVPYEIHVRERTGTKFVGDKFDNGTGRNHAKVEGEIDGSSITWREYPSNEPNALVQVGGVLKGGKIPLKFNGNIQDGRKFGGDGELVPQSEKNLVPPQPVKDNVNLVVDPKHIQRQAGELRLLDKGETLPPGPFWPELSPENSAGWSFANPAGIKMNARELVVSAGTGGNALLTKNQELKSCKLTIEIEATEETVAYLALRANKDGKGWHAVTSKIEAKAGKVRVGGQGVDFEESAPMPPLEFEFGKPIPLVFNIDDNGKVALLIRGKPTATAKLAGLSAGAAGVFVQAGSLRIRNLSVR